MRKSPFLVVVEMVGIVVLGLQACVKRGNTQEKAAQTSAQEVVGATGTLLIHWVKMEATGFVLIERQCTRAVHPGIVIHKQWPSECRPVMRTHWRLR